MALATLSYAKDTDCYSGGQEAKKEQRLAQQSDEQLEIVCSALTGKFFKGERKSNCVASGVADTKFDFEILNVKETGKEGRNSFLELYECKDGIKKQLECSHGGKTKYEHWQYRCVDLPLRLLWSVG